MQTYYHNTWDYFSKSQTFIQDFDFKQQEFLCVDWSVSGYGWAWALVPGWDFILGISERFDKTIVSAWKVYVYDTV
jgi:hypothetical protein